MLCQFTVTESGPCLHSEESHGTDQEVDLDGRPTGPQYLVCFECLEQGHPHWSHDFDQGYEDLFPAPWVERVWRRGEYALVVEMPAASRKYTYWWVLCPAAATLITEVPPLEDDPTNPDDHEACSISPECDFHELHVLAHESIRARAARNAKVAL